MPPEVGHATPPSLPPPASLPELREDREEAASRAELLLEAALGPVDRLREEIDRIRKDPDYGAEEMIERLRGTMTTVLEARDLASLTGAFPKLGAALGGHASDAKSTPPRAPEPALAIRAKDANARPASVPPPPPAPPPAAIDVRSPSTALARYEPQTTDTRAFVEALLETREASAIFDVIDRSLDRLRELDVSRKEGIATVREALERLRSGS